MKPILYAFGLLCAAAVLPLVLASSIGGIGGGGPPILIYHGATGQSTLAAYDDASGILTIVRNATASDPEWKYVNVRRYGYFDGRFLTAADFDGDGQEDLALPGYAANKVLVFWSRSFDGATIEVEEFSIGAGPAAIAPAQLDSTREFELLAASVAGPEVVIRGYDLSHRLTRGAATFPDDFATGGLLGIETLGGARGASDPLLGVLHFAADDAFNPSVTILTRFPSPEYGPMNVARTWKSRSGHQLLISGFPEGVSRPGWFLAYAPGSAAIELFPSGPGTDELILLETPVRSVSFIPEIDDQVLVMYENGQAEVFDFQPGNGFESLQILNPPPGMEFAAAGAGGNLSFVRLNRDEPGAGPAHAVFQKIGGQYLQTSLTLWPEPPAFENHVTVVLYAGNPFATPPPFPFETFLEGDWATAASFAGGNVMASVETFGGLAEGLGNPAPHVLAPNANPGAGAHALGNQWEPSSSLFYAFNTAASDGLAAVSIQPAPGDYANSIAVTFQPSPDVTPHYRVNQGPWSSGSGPVWISQDASIQYYGEHSSGALSSIQSAVYDIDQSFTTDADGDGVPDVIESLAGTNPFSGDSDGDGVGDFREILENAQGGNGESCEFAANIDALGLRRLIVEWDDPKSAALPASDQEFLLSDLENRSEESSRKQALGDHVFELPSGNAQRLHKVWLPAGYQVGEARESAPWGPALTSFVALDPALPSAIPVDLMAPDPLAAWRASACEALESASAAPQSARVGPASLMSALLLESWYGFRLLELGRIVSLDARPRLADTPRSPLAGAIDPEDLAAVESPSQPDLLVHEAAHTLQQLNHSILNEAPYQLLRDTAESFYAAAVAALRAGSPLDPPLDALRRVLDGFPPPAGYPPINNPSALVSLRDQLLAQVAPRQAVALTLELFFEVSPAGHAELIGRPVGASSPRYRLIDTGSYGFNVAGIPLELLPPPTLPGAGLLIPGTIATVIGVPVATTDVAVEPITIAVEVIVLESVPMTSDLDRDGNGLPDTWQYAFLGGLGTPFGQDSDGDGFLDPEEYAAGSDPNDATSVPAGTPASPRNLGLGVDEAGNVSIVWDGSPTAVYQLWVATNLSDWAPYGVAPMSDGIQTWVAQLSGEELWRFFRVHVTIPLP